MKSSSYGDPVYGLPPGERGDNTPVLSLLELTTGMVFFLKDGAIEKRSRPPPPLSPEV